MQLYKLPKFIEEEDSTIASNAMYNNERRMYQNRGENLSNKYHCHISFHLHIPVTPDKIQIYRSSSTSLSAAGFN